MGNVNFVKVKSLKYDDFYDPESSLNIYLDDSNFIAKGYIEGKRIDFTLNNEKNQKMGIILFMF